LGARLPDIIFYELKLGERLPDMILKGDHPMTIKANFGST
jgi:hypothetical protein